MKITFLILSAAWFFLFSGLGLFFAFRKGREKNPELSIKRYMPAEFFAPNLLCFALFSVGLLGAVFPSIALNVSLTNVDASLRTYLSFATVISALTALFFLLLSYVSPSNERPHLGLYVLSGIALMFECAIYGLSVLAFRMASTEGTILVVIASLLFVLGALAIPLLMNPKLKRWYELEAVTEPDGQVSYRRPKIFVLALSEWILLLLFVLAHILFTLAVYVILLA